MSSTIDTTSNEYDGEQVAVRLSSGLIKGWSTYDAFIYNFLGANPIALALFAFSLAPIFPDGNLVWAVVLSGTALLLQAFVGAALISVMPRAGGDYLWQSRLIHGAVGFIIVGVAWWFVNCHWGALYNSLFVQGIYAPLASTLGWHGFTTFLTTPTGVFSASVVLIVFITLVGSVGLRRYAAIQKAGFYLGFITLLVVFVILLVNSKTDFIAAFNRGATQTFGAGPDAYASALKAGQYDGSSVGHVAIRPTLLLIPLVLFFNIWTISGNALYGEVRRASDFRRTFLSIGGPLVLSTVLAATLLLLISKTMDWHWYNAINNAYLTQNQGNPIPIWPSPLLFVGWLLHNKILTILLILGISGWYWGLAPNLFLGASRTIFAIAYDRILPEWFASVSGKRGVPVGALTVLASGTLLLSAVYAYVPGFDTLTLDGIVPFAVVGIFSGIAATLLPWRGRRLFESSPLAHWKLGAVPVVSVVGTAYTVFISVVVYAWLTRTEYGVNNLESLIYLGSLYLLASAIYLTAWVIRRRQGFSLGLAQKEIPVD